MSVNARTLPDEVVPLPPWSRVSDKRRAHIGRVVALLAEWARELRLDETETRAFRDAGLLHDALRDATEPELRALTGDTTAPYGVLHGPGAARVLANEGEVRTDLLEAIRWHTVGNPSWGRVGRALYMADYLEPGRPFMQPDRAWLAERVPEDFDGVFRQVVRQRLEWTLREGKELFPESVGLWNSVR